MKKIFYNIFILFSILSFGISTISFCDDIDEEVIDVNAEILETTSPAQSEIKIPETNSRACVVIDRNTNTILYGKNEKQQRKMASTTKIMTATIIIENCNLDETIEISKKAAGTGGSKLGLKTGDKITIRDLLYGLMLRSGNDAAVALAEYAGGNIEGFAELMNKKASELSLTNTHFETPHGLDSDEHYTTAYELALLSNYALNNTTFAQIVGTKEYTITINGYPKQLSNTNELLGNFEGVYGIKTGFTNGANRCLVTACKRGDMDIICVVLGADTKKFRTVDSVKLIEYAYSNYKNIEITDLINDKYSNWKETYGKKVVVNKGIQKNIETKLEDIEKKYITIKNGEEDDIYVQIDSIDSLEAPVQERIIIGKIKLFVNDEIKVTINIINDKKVEKMNVIDYYKKLLTNNFENMCEV